VNLVELFKNWGNSSINMLELSDEIDDLCSRKGGKPFHVGVAGDSPYSDTNKACTDCKLRVPVLYCPTCEELSIMPNGECLSCNAELLMEDLLSSFTNEKLIVYNINACKYKRDFIDITDALGFANYLTTTTEEIETKVLSGDYGDVNRAKQELMELIKRNPEKKHEAADSNQVVKSEIKERSLFMCKVIKEINTGIANIDR
jgi:hypothetical protein